MDYETGSARLSNLPKDTGLRHSKSQEEFECLCWACLPPGSRVRKEHQALGAPMRWSLAKTPCFHQ